MKGSRKQSKSKKKILIIGGGVSGLSCAYHLKLFAGVQIEIWEGRDRLGGRIWTHTVGSKDNQLKVELGAQWAHGVIGNPTLAHGLEIDLSPDQRRNIDSLPVLNSSSSRHYAFDSSGNDITKTYRQFEEAFSELWRKAKSLSLSYQKKKLNDISLRDAVNEMVSGEFEEYWKRVLGVHIYESCLNKCLVDQECYWAVPHEHFSLKFLADEHHEPIESEKPVINGYDTLVKNLSKDLNIKLNHIVQSIVYNESTSKLTVSAIHNSQDVVAEVDYVVLTVPLGVLKRGSITFTPELSKKKLKSIQRLGMGSKFVNIVITSKGILNKVVLQFSEVFWPRDVSWVNHCTPDRTEFTTFFSLFRKTGQKALVGYIAPQLTTRIREENWDESTVIEKSLQVLKRGFGEQIDAYFVSGFVTRWDLDPFSYGSYSHIPLNGQGSDYDSLSQPEMNGHLLFCGEATYRKHQGTVCGAFMSGQREATRLAQDLNLDF